MITIEEGRKTYNLMRSGSALERYRMKDHETVVEEFFAKKMLESPIQTAQVFAAYPVLTDLQMEDRRERELYAFGPEDDEDDETTNGLTAVASLAAGHAEAERIALAELRGEPV